MKVFILTEKGKQHTLKKEAGDKMFDSRETAELFAEKISLKKEDYDVNFFMVCGEKE